MKLGVTNGIVAAFLIVSIAGFTLPAFAQNQQGRSGQSFEMAAGASSGEYEGSDPQTEDREVSEKIEKARSAGKNVTAAEKHQKLGEAAIKSGDNKAALRHFEEAETALGEKEENEEHGGESRKGAGY